jgi:hypothetical protein
MQTLEKFVSLVSVQPICPRCKSVIPGEDINVARDIAFCRNCNVSHSLSALSSGRVVDENVDVSRPPDGTWFRREGDGLVLGATNRSLGSAFGLLFFAVFWNGIVSFFVLAALVSTLHHLGVSAPEWFPASLAKSGTNMPLGLTIFLWIFLTPFIAIGLFVFSQFLNCLAGRTEVRLQGGRGVIFTGVGHMGFRKRFAASDVRDVRIEDKSWFDSKGNPRRNTQIVIDTNINPLKFGNMLAEPRRGFMAGALKKELVRQ